MDFINFVTSEAIGFIAVAAGVIIAVVEFFKSLGLQSRWAPLAAVILGSSIGFVYGGFASPAFDILAGFLSGLAASGLYSGVKTTTE